MRWPGLQRGWYPMPSCPFWRLRLGRLDLTIGRGIGRWEVTVAWWTWRLR